jgi:DNA polymerase-3 subunit alpha
MGDRPFVHLRTHSAFSLLEGAMHLDKLVKLAVEDRQPALALTDTSNLFGALEFSEKAAEAGIQPLVGCTLALDFEDNEDEGRFQTGQFQPLESLVVLALSEGGYQDLMHLVSQAYLREDEHGRIFVRLEELQKRSSGLLVLTGGPRGPLGQLIASRKISQAEQRLLWLQSVFQERLFIEVQRHGEAQDKATEAAHLQLAARHKIPLVATNDCLFARPDDFEAHDVLSCIAAGQVVADEKRPRLTPDYAFKTQSQMKALFQDLPDAIVNTCQIARMVDFRPRTSRPLLPRFAVSDTQDQSHAIEKAPQADDILREEADMLRQQALQGLQERLQVNGLADGLSEDDYIKRLHYELDVIIKMEFPGYFLIVADFIQWAKKRGIPVGPGRGSGAGSVVAWALTITDLDPLRFSLLFERFLNPDRVSMPDFDIDFCQERRDEVIHYVQKRYGADRVAQIITFGSLQARAVLRDVGRVLQMPYGQVDRLCKMVPANPANPVKLPEAIAQEPRLREEARKEEVVDRLLDIGQRLEGLYRHASTHAAGIVIGDRPLQELVPLFRDPRSDLPVTQFNMKWAEKAGLVKFDFLGLKTLTVIRKTVELLHLRNIDLDVPTLPLDDAPTYALYARGETAGVFQVESAGMRRALIEMRPDRFEDIIALVALYRPGPMDNIPRFNARKHGLEEPDYPHPLLEPILKETHGIIVYQEQVMQIAQVLSGYSLGEADLLRRAMGKKIRSEMDKQKTRFIEGAVEKGLDAELADNIFELVAKFANYGFNKSHAAAYALVSYQTAYLKAHYPVEFLSASMTLDIHNTDKLSEFRKEAVRLKVPILPPCVNRSDVEFAVQDGAILYALAALKGVGHQAAEHIVEERHKSGDYQSLDDFVSRIQPRIINKRCLESLIAAGALDCFEPNRACLMAGLDHLLAVANRAWSEKDNPQVGLFGTVLEEQKLDLPACQPWDNAMKLQHELQAVGFYISAHPLDDYLQEFDGMGVTLWSSFAQAVKDGLMTAGRLCGVVMSYQERKTKSGNRLGIIQFSDPTGHFEAIAFSDFLDQHRDDFTPGTLLQLDISANFQDDDFRMRLQRIQRLDRRQSRQACHLSVYLDDINALKNIANILLRAGSGQGQAKLFVLDEQRRNQVELLLPQTYDFTPQFASALQSLKGVQTVEWERTGWA